MRAMNQKSKTTLWLASVFLVSILIISTISPANPAFASEQIDEDISEEINDGNAGKNDDITKEDDGNAEINDDEDGKVNENEEGQVDEEGDKDDDKQPMPGTKDTITFLWHDPNNENVKWYNPEDEGKQVKFRLTFYFTGIHVGETEETIHGEPAFYTYKGTIGNNAELTITINDINREITWGKEYQSFRLVTPFLHMDASNKANRFYAPVTVSDSKPVIRSFSQNMNLDVINTIRAGNTVSSEDQDKIGIRYTIELQEGDSIRYPVMLDENRVLEHSQLFKEGFIDLLNPAVNSTGLIANHISQNKLWLYNQETGNKDRTYILHADFTGEYAEEMNERYALEVTGDDLTGWEVILSEKNPTPDPPEPPEPPEPSSPEKPSEVTPIFDKEELAQIIFDPSGAVWADGTSDPIVYYAEVGDYITIPDGPMKDGAVFLYWQGSKYYPGDQYKVEGDHFFIARFGEYEEVDSQEPTNQQTQTDNTEQPSIKTDQAVSLPKTGENSNLAIPALLLALAGFSFLLTIRKKLG